MEFQQCKCAKKIRGDVITSSLVSYTFDQFEDIFEKEVPTKFNSKPFLFARH